MLPSVYYVDEYGFMRQSSLNYWEEDGKHDALFRTSLAYLIYGDKKFYDAIMSCFVLENGLLKVYRHRDYGSDTVSRDQIAAALVALKLRGNYHDVKFIVENLKWKLSNRFNQTLDFYFWQKSLLCNRKFANIFYIITFFMFLFVIPWNYVIRKIVGLKSVDQKKFIPDQFFNLSNWKQKAIKMMYPTFALFLLALQIKAAPTTFLKSVVQNLVLLEVEPSNHFIRNALNKKSMDKSYISMRGIRWNDRLDQSNDNGLRLMKRDEIGRYDFDRDLLIFSYRVF